MEQQKKRNRLISLAVCLLMLATLMVPLNVQVADAATTNLQNPRTASDGTVTWDCVWFGHYPQSSDGKGGFNKDPIKWRVLSVDGNEALLLADKILDTEIPYNKSFNVVTWATCTMRSWLNGYGSTFNQDGIDYTSDNFIDKAFSTSEQNAILQKTVENADNPAYGTEEELNTMDKLFIPSVGEMTNPIYGFPTNPEESANSRTAVYTAYSANKSSYNVYEGKLTSYWLRERGYGSNYAPEIINDGYVYLDGIPVYETDENVRPVLRLNLTSNLWSYAGTVSSEDNVINEGPIEPETPNQPPSKPTTPVVKASQTITAQSFTKTYGNKPFSLGAKAKTKLTYKSSDTKVATVNNNGQVTLKGPGKATITITAAATNNYNAATKKITITVKPKQTAGLKVQKGKKRMTVSWKRDKKATGYQITYAQNKKFKKGKKNITISKNKTVKRAIKKLKARKTYYVKVRAYKKVGKTKIYGDYSKVKKVKVR